MMDFVQLDVIALILQTYYGHVRRFLDLTTCFLGTEVAPVTCTVMVSSCMRRFIDMVHSHCPAKRQKA